jgi:hypothetical protein
MYLCLTIMCPMFVFREINYDIEDVVATPEKVVDVVAIMFGDVKVIISNQMTTMWGDMKRKKEFNIF